MEKAGPDYDVLIIGSGMSGMALSVNIRESLPHANIAIIERETHLGGTWNLNTYPGAGCDVPSHFYSYSFALNPNWSRFMSKQQEIHDYQVSVAREQKIFEIIKFGTRCNGAHWDTIDKIWVVNLFDEAKGTAYTLRTTALVSAVGALHIPNDCPIPGAQNFQGQLFHSARWNHDVDLTGKKVVVVGNGCSATQFVPVILKQAQSIRQFVRSKHYLMPNPDFEYSAKAKNLFSRFPVLMKLHRYMIATVMDSYFAIFYVNGIGGWLRKLYKKRVLAYMRKACPPAYHDVIIPDFEIGCKRRVVDTGYLQSLHSPSLTVSNSPLLGVSEHAVHTATESLVADVIILANGFKVGKYILDLRGENGIGINEYWAKEGGAEAYFGTCLSAFPNFFLSMGPNSGTGHYSYIFTAECQNKFITKLLSKLIPPPAELGKKHVLRVTRKAEDEEKRWIAEKSNELILGEKGGCTSWYSQDGKNVAVYPHFQAHYWLRSVFVRWQDFEVDGVPSPAGNRASWRSLIIAAVGIASLGLYMS